MTHARQEDLQMKIPAVLHLLRLGYHYLSREQIRERDRKTNILPNVLQEAVERINGIRMTAEQGQRLMEELTDALDADDLGRRFYETIRNGWSGLRLIDYAHPELNLFQSATEVTCGRGSGCFRPDITLFVNGLPLAIMEVKTRKQARGLQAEYDRMAERTRGGESSRRYLQGIQVWAFADDHGEDPHPLWPTKGASFATMTVGALPIYAIRGANLTRSRRSGLFNQEEEQRILADNGFPGRPGTRAFQRSLSARKPAHRMMTALFAPERFLFLLRYGIQYVRETEPGEQEFLTRRMLTVRHLTVLESLEKKARRGFRNWTVPSCGAAGEQAARAAMVAVLRDLWPGAALYWICDTTRSLQQEQEMLESCGTRCGTEKQAGNTGNDAVILMTMDRDPRTWIQEAGEMNSGNRRVWILPPPDPAYGQRGNFRNRLRRADPDAILVTRTMQLAQEGSSSILLLQKRME